MSNWPLQRTAAAGDTTTEITVSSSATAGTFGAWTQLDAAIPLGVVGFIVHCPNAANGDRNTLKFGIGASGSEVAITDPIPHTLTSSAFTAASFWMPVRLPGGGRLSVALTTQAASVRSIPMRVQYLFGTALTPLSGSIVTTHGFDIANTRGTAVSASGTANVFGTSVQLIASTPARASAVSIRLLGNTNGINIAGRARLFYGTSSISACPDIEIMSNSDIVFGGKIQHVDWHPCDIPAGSDLRIAFAQRGTAVPQRGFYIHLLH